MLAVVEALRGAPGRRSTRPALPCRSYGEDIPFLDRARRDATTEGPGRVGEALGARAGNSRRLPGAVGRGRLERLEAALGPARAGASTPRRIPSTRPRHRRDWERAAVHATRELRRIVERTDADAVLAGAGVANLAAWVAVGQCRAEGIERELTAELGMLGYTPDPGGPVHLQPAGVPLHLDARRTRRPCSAWWSADRERRSSGCLGAAQVDSVGNLNSTDIPGGPFLVGSGGANDVASRAAACVVVVLARPERLVERAGYMTSPGRNVESVATDLGVLRRHDGVLRVEAVPWQAGSRSVRGPGQALRAGADGKWRSPGGRGASGRSIRPRCWPCADYDPEGLFLN